MEKLPEAYPLTWPTSRPRTPPGKRTRAQFGKRKSYSKDALTMAEAIDRLGSELGRLRVQGEPIVSSNVTLRLDGLPRSNQGRPIDPGVAVYFRWKGQTYVMACDRWDRPEDNVAAIAAHIGALRGIDRWGVVEAEEVFAGFKALPEKAGASRRPWWEILGVGPGSGVAEIKKAFHAKALQAHPDRGGDRGAWDELQAAFEEGSRAAQVSL